MNTQLLKIKSEVIECVHEVYRSGLQTGAGGNFSARLPGTEYILIKPGGFSFIECEVDNLVVVDLNGKQVDGESRPSTEIETHLRVYNWREDIGAILHCHSPLVIAYAEVNEEVKAIAYHIARKLGDVPILKTGDIAEIPEDRLRRLIDGFPGTQALIHARHGIFAFGSSLLKARFNAELVVENIQTLFYADIFRKAIRQARTVEAAR